MESTTSHTENISDGEEIMSIGDLLQGSTTGGNAYTTQQDQWQEPFLPIDGSSYYDINSNEYKIYIDGNWQPVLSPTIGIVDSTLSGVLFVDEKGRKIHLSEIIDKLQLYEKIIFFLLHNIPKNLWGSKQQRAIELLAEVIKGIPEELEKEEEGPKHLEDELFEI